MRTALAIMSFAALALCATARADETGMASQNDLRKEGGRLCMADHAHTGSGTGKTKDAARRAANQTWYEYTAWEYGSDWARLGKAAGVKIRYTKEAVGWTATIDARPCK